MRSNFRNHKISFRILVQQVFFNFSFLLLGSALIFLLLDFTFYMRNTEAIYYAINFDIEHELLYFVGDDTWVYRYLFNNWIVVGVLFVLSVVLSIAHIVYGFTNIVADYVTALKLRSLYKDLLIIVLVCILLSFMLI